MNRCACALPKAIKSFCESGCIYRERNFKHLRCPQATKADTCVAPCPQPCECSPRPIVVVETKKVTQLQ